MGVLTDRISIISTCLTERLRRGFPEVSGPVDRKVLFILDGVGGLQSVPMVVRAVIRATGLAIGTVVFVWQFGVPGEIWTDLMWARRNRVMGAKLARRLLAFRRAHPDTAIYVLGFSGGTGIAVFACESLKGRRLIETLVLAAPALSAEYNLAPALRAVRRCYALVSEEDWVVLGAGTRVFGTMDRRFVSAAGRWGFRLPRSMREEELAAYERFGQIRWSKDLTAAGHSGGHTGSVTRMFLARHLVGLLRGEPGLPVERIGGGRLADP